MDLLTLTEGIQLSGEEMPRQEYEPRKVLSGPEYSHCNQFTAMPHYDTCDFAGNCRCGDCKSDCSD